MRRGERAPRRRRCTLREQFGGAELRFEIIGVGFDRRAIHVVRVLVSFEMNEGARDQGQLACGFGIVVGVVLDERFVDCFGAIFLAGEFEEFGTAQIAFEFVALVLSDFCGVGGGAFELSDGFGVAAGQGECFGEFVTNCALSGVFWRNFFAVVSASVYVRFRCNRGAGLRCGNICVGRLGRRR